MAKLQQIYEHRRAYPEFIPDTLEARADAVDQDAAQLAAYYEQRHQEVIDAHAAQAGRAEAVDSYLNGIKESDAELFEQVRREPFEQQAARAGV